MAVVFGAPGPIIGPAPSPRSRIQHKWIGWDGSEWDLTAAGGRSGVVLLNDDVRGLSMPEFDRFTESSAARHGQRLRGWQVKQRDVLWPVLVYQDDSSEAWVRYDAAFWHSLHPMSQGTWEVTAPGSETRRLRCTVGSAEQALKRDPAFAQWAIWAVPMISDDAFWTGKPEAPQFRDAQPVNWLGGGPVGEAGAGGPLVASMNATASTASVLNAGDLDGWVRWTVDGPVDAGLELGVGDRLVTIDTAIAEGSRLVLDTDPESQQVILDGAEYIPSKVPRFAPIPAGGVTPLVVTMKGAGVVTATLTPRYFRAW